MEEGRNQEKRRGAHQEMQQLKASGATVHAGNDGVKFDKPHYGAQRATDCRGQSKAYSQAGRRVRTVEPWTHHTAAD